MLRVIVFIRPYARYLLVAWLLAIIIVSSIPSVPVLRIRTPGKELRLDYLIHFLEYGTLSFLALLAFSGESFRTGRKKLLLIISCLLLFAVTEELHQKIIPGRTFNIRDIYSNISGILAALIFSVIVFRRIAGRIIRSSSQEE